MEIEITKDYNVRRLQQWLDFELSSSVMLVLSYFWSFTILLMALAAIIFTPFMIKVLWEERKHGWIIFFFFVVIVPIVLSFVFGFYAEYKSIAFLLSLAMFYFYCFILRLVVKDW